MTTVNTNIVKTLGAADIDTQELVANLVAATKEPRQKFIDADKKKADVAISTGALLNNAISTLQSAATEIAGLAKLNQLTASSSNSGVVTGAASGTGSTRAGNYSVKVTALAEPQRRTSNELASGFTSTASQTLTFSSATGANGFVTSGIPSENVVTIPAGSSLDTVVSLINESAIAKNNDIKASLVDKKTAASGAGPYVIVIQGKSGTANGFSILTTDSGDASRDELGLDRAKTEPKLTDNPARNAAFTINNVALERSSNTVTDAISGVSLNLNSAPGEGTTVNLRISANPAAVEANVSNFVEAYNLVASIIKRATGPAVEGDDISGTMKSDSNARSILTLLRNKLTKESSSPSGDVTHWGSLGVSFDRNGVLKFDNSKFSSKFESSPDDVIKALSNNRLSPSLFSQDVVNGLAGDVASAAHAITKSTGILKAITDGYEAKLDRVATKQTTLDAYIERLTAQYEKQFSALNSVLGSFKDTQKQLERSLNLNNNNN